METNPKDFDLAQYIKNKIHLKILDLRKIKEEILTSSVLESISEHKAIHIVSFSCNDFTLNAIQNIFKCINKNQNIHTLDLSANNLVNKDAKVIEKFLKDNQSLRTLKLKYNNIGNKEAKGIIDAFNSTIPNTPPCRYLDLSYNAIGEGIGKAIDKDMLSSFRKLNLSNNNLEEEDLLRLLKLNKTIGSRLDKTKYKPIKLVKSRIFSPIYLIRKKLYRDEYLWKLYGFMKLEGTEKDIKEVLSY